MEPITSWVTRRNRRKLEQDLERMRAADTAELYWENEVGLWLPVDGRMT
jgi:hypothetical protein